MPHLPWCRESIWPPHFLLIRVWIIHVVQPKKTRISSTVTLLRKWNLYGYDDSHVFVSRWMLTVCMYKLYDVRIPFWTVTLNKKKREKSPPFFKKGLFLFLFFCMPLYRRIVTLEKSRCLMGIGLINTGRTTAIGSIKYAVLRRSVSVSLIGSQGFRARRTVTLEKSSRSQTSSSMMVESLDILLFWESIS